MNKRLALMPITGMVLLTLAGCATNTSHFNAIQKSTASSSDVNGTVSNSSNASLTAQQLSFQVRDKLLRQMSSPGQGEDCLNQSCSVSGTSFSGPSVTNQNDTLHMVYVQFKGWYIIVAPTTKNALEMAQQLIQKPLNFPSTDGVIVVHSKNTEYYWISNGKENSKSEKLP